MNALASLVHGWLALPVWAILFSLLALLVLCAVACCAFISRIGDRLPGLGRTSPSMVMVVALLFALLTGFLGSDISQRTVRAQHAVANEARALTMIEALSQGGAQRFANLRSLGEQYARLVIDEEFTRDADSGESSAVKRTLDDLKREAAAILLDGAPASGRALDSALLLGEARAERLIIRQETSGYQWVTVIALSLLLIVALALVHIDNLKGFIVGSVVYITAAVTVMGMLAIRENPFSPPISISSEPFEDVLNIFKHGSSADRP